MEQTFKVSDLAECLREYMREYAESDTRLGRYGQRHAQDEYYGASMLVARLSGYYGFDYKPILAEYEKRSDNNA